MKTRMASQILKGVLLVLVTLTTVLATAPIAFEPEISQLVTKAVPNPEKYRLTENEYAPTKYELTISLANDFLDTKKFKGVVKIHIIPKTAPTKKSLFLHRDELTNVEYTIFKAAGNEEVAKTDKPANTTFQTQEIVFTNNPTNDPLIIEAKYEGKLHTDMRGLYITSYQDSQKNPKFALATQFEPTFARRLMPCFDEPEFKATFSLTIKYPEKFKVLFNTKSSEKSLPEQGIITESFKQTPSMSTYLLAIIVSEFDYVSTTVDGVKHSVWSRYQDTEGSVVRSAYGLELSPKLIKVMADYTDKKYKDVTIGKVDHVALPDFSAGAMENWGLITYRESLFLLDEKESTARSKQRVCSIVAHELAHFWFGNLKTTKWWDNTWLNEGFARYFEYMAADKVQPQFELEKQFVVEQHLAVMNTDSIATTQALESKVDAPSEIQSKFGSISYNKGASIIRMMSHWTTKEKFKNILKNYFNDGKTSAVPADLYAAARGEIDIDHPIADVLTSYVQQPGLPLLSVNLREDYVEITQKRFTFEPLAEDQKKFYFVPITYTLGPNLNFNDTNIKFCLTNTSSSVFRFPLSNNELLIVNVAASAYARVNYDDVLWNRIIEDLNAEKPQIEDINRAQIVDDALNLARADVLKYNRAFEIIKFLKKETSYYPWYSALNAFQYLIKRVAHDSDESIQLKRFVLDLLEGVKTSPIDHNKHIDILKNALITSWRCNLGEEACKNDMVKLFKRVNESAFIDPNLRSTVYCVGLRESTVEGDWDKLYQRYETTTLPSEKQIILAALGCTKQPALLKKYLTKTITDNSGIRTQDFSLVFSSVAGGSTIGLKEAVEFFKSNYDAIRTKHDELDSSLRTLTEQFVTEAQIKEFRDYLQANPTVPFKDSATSLLKECDKNVNWKSKNFPTILEYIRVHFNGPEPPSGGGETTPKPSSAGANSVTILLLVVNVFIMMCFKL